MPYVELQTMLDEGNAWGFHCYEKGTYIENLSDEVIEVVTEHLPLKKSPMSLVLFYRLDGAYSRAGDNETAFSGGRSPRFSAFVVGIAPNADLLAVDRGWVRAFWDALRPHAVGSGDGYINGMVDYGEDRLRSAYGAAKYDRLARIKGKYDPENIFHPTQTSSPPESGTVYQGKSGPHGQEGEAGIPSRLLSLRRRRDGISAPPGDPTTLVPRPWAIPEPRPWRHGPVLTMRSEVLFGVNADPQFARVPRSVVLSRLSCGYVPVCVDPCGLVASVPLTARCR